MIQMKKPSTASLFILVFAFGMVTQTFIGRISAQQGGTINGCIRPLTSLLRIIGDNQTCNNNETLLSWSQSGGSLFPIFCPSCEIGDNVGTRLVGQNLSNSYLFRVNFENTNLTSTNLSNSELSDSFFINTNADEANFTNARIESANFDGANLNQVNFTNANLLNSDLSSATLTDVLWSNTTCPDGTNSNGNGNTCEGHLIP